ncbi:Pr6Pr family membrane protein [Bacillus pacificus]
MYSPLSSIGTATWSDQGNSLRVLRGAAAYTYLRLDSFIFLLLRGVRRMLSNRNTMGKYGVILYLCQMPCFLDWILNPPNKKNLLETSRRVGSTYFPFFYVLYSLIRGPIVNWYPHPFLDPRISGYGRGTFYTV